MRTTLRIRKTFDSSLDLAIRWYGVISILNDFNWSPMEIHILAYTACKGDISSGGRREAFCSLFNYAKGSLGNCISALQKKYFLVKLEGKIKIHPQLVMNFEAPIHTELLIDAKGRDNR